MLLELGRISTRVGKNPQPCRPGRSAVRLHIMSAVPDCCDASNRAPRHALCPITGTTGTRVQLQTVKALLKDESQRRLVQTTYYFCPEPDCRIVYFSEQGDCYSIEDLRTTVWQKEPSGNRLLCYCFGESEQTISTELAATGTSKALDESRNRYGWDTVRATFAIHVGSVASLTSEPPLRVWEALLTLPIDPPGPFDAVGLTEPSPLSKLGMQ